MERDAICFSTVGIRWHPYTKGDRTGKIVRINIEQRILNGELKNKVQDQFPGIAKVR